ncbi:Na+/H+ antiporter NhaA [Bartonella sp. DGB1]|uniref:Na+/H+ antiporter NhaA n=1 Tax=Bartonella sp. DGB1 TaxID=3239807 RepID=UPI003525C03B
MLIFHYDKPNKGQRVKKKILSIVDHFAHIEATSGVFLLLAAAIAIIFANSSYGYLYNEFLAANINFSINNFSVNFSVSHFINDGLMTVFFLIIGLEIRREMHDGVLSDFKQASLPVFAAIGGVIVPAVIYFLFNYSYGVMNGWAIPTATDIAFSLGVLALLGNFLPSHVRVILLTLAVVDDIIAVLIIALFYSSGIHLPGFYIIAIGVMIIYLLRWLAINKILFYLIPAFLVWYGFEEAGIHASLAGVVLGLLAPVRPFATNRNPIKVMKETIGSISEEASKKQPKLNEVSDDLKILRKAHRRTLPPVVSLQNVLHGWVSYGVMPIFAFANAGVAFGGIALQEQGSLWIFLGISTGLLIGKPLGIVGVSWLVTRLNICQLPKSVKWVHMLLIGLLAGIGFTMAIFVAVLSFSSDAQLSIAKLAVLLASVLSAICGLILGAILVFFNKKDEATKKHNA